MKVKLITSFFLASALVTSAVESSLTGRWSVSSDIAGNQSTIAIILKQEGDKLTGVAKMHDKEVPVTGTVSGKKIVWQYCAEWQSDLLTLVYVGSCNEAGKISGNVEVRPMDVEGSFFATRETKP